VVNNAGAMKFQLIDDVSEEDFRFLIETNLTGTFAICRHAAKILSRSGSGTIVNTVSNQWAAPTGSPAYAASKGGVASLTYDLAWELRRNGVTVNAIAPFAATRLTDDMAQWDDLLAREGLMNEQRRQVKEERADPALVAPIVVFLASDAARDITGLIFRAGGGKIGVYQHPTENRTIFRDDSEGPWSPAQLVDLLPRTLLARDTIAPHLHSRPS